MKIICLSDPTATKQLCLAVLLFLTTVPSSQAHLSPADPKTDHPDLNQILESLERVEQRPPPHSRAYEVTRAYKVFRDDDKQPTSEVTAQISFVPPETKTARITQASGNSRGEQLVRKILEQEALSARTRQNSAISRMNYDFVFLRQENFGLVPEYVLRIVPKRKQKDLLGKGCEVCGPEISG